VTIELSKNEFRRLLDMVYIGNWILNSTRDEGDRIRVYDELESKIFAQCVKNGMPALLEVFNGEILPSKAFAEGGIHEAIMEYEDTVFFEMLAEELAMKDMNYEPVNARNFAELEARIEEYMEEFEQNGTENIRLDK